MMLKSVAEHRDSRILTNFIVTETYAHTRGILIAFVSIGFWQDAEGTSIRKDGSYIYIYIYIIYIKSSNVKKCMYV
jgi:hypothetical protein